MYYKLVLIGLLIVFIIILLYNRLATLRETVNNEKRQIDIQLDRRYKIYESLIGAVSKYLDYEKTVLKDVVALRSQANNTGDEANRIASENAISEISSGLSIMIESYPDLKGNSVVLQLMEEISSTENKLSFAKQSYNDAVERFNAAIQRFPANLLARLMSFEVFNYWELSSDDVKSKEDYTVKL